MTVLMEGNGKNCVDIIRFKCIDQVVNDEGYEGYMKKLAQNKDSWSKIKPVKKMMSARKIRQLCILAR